MSDMKPCVKFIVFADLHVDIMPDAVARMQVILDAAQTREVDLIIQLGDMMYPDADFLAAYAPDSLRIRDNTAWFVNDRDDEKKEIKRMIRAAGIPFYSVLGNHDMDSCSKATACKYFGIPAPFYSFDHGGIRFIVLDTNFIKSEDQYIDFDHCNYGRLKEKETTWLDPPQLSFLEQTLSTSPYDCILLSHASLADELHQVHNREEIYNILRRVNRESRKAILALNGHSHIDGIIVREGVPFMNINSASNIWIGHQYDCIRYSETISRHYPHIQGTAPYWDVLFAIFEITESGIEVEGRMSSYVGPSPYKLGFQRNESYHLSTPCIESRKLPLDRMEDTGHPDGFSVTEK